MARRDAATPERLIMGDASANGQSRPARAAANGASAERGRAATNGGLAQAIRDQTGDGRELARFMLEVCRGEHADATLDDRVRAATWLADRGWGKPGPAMDQGRRDAGPVAFTIQIADGDAETSD